MKMTVGRPKVRWMGGVAEDLRKLGIEKMVDSHQGESRKKVPRQVEVHDDDYDDDKFHTSKAILGEFDTCNYDNCVFLDACECRYKYCVILTR
jgi:hypothetical protein